MCLADANHQYALARPHLAWSSPWVQQGIPGRSSRPWEIRGAGGPPTLSTALEPTVDWLWVIVASITSAQQASAFFLARDLQYSVSPKQRRLQVLVM